MAHPPGDKTRQFTQSGRPMPVLEVLGEFQYTSSIGLTTGSVAITGRVVNFRIFAQGADGQFDVDGGDAIMVRSGTGFDWSPRTPLLDPTFNHLSGTLDIFIEYTDRP